MKKVNGAYSILSVKIIMGPRGLVIDIPININIQTVLLSSVYFNNVYS
jgi:hypothetical protein